MYLIVKHYFRLLLEVDNVSAIPIVMALESRDTAEIAMSKLLVLPASVNLQM